MQIASHQTAALPLVAIVGRPNVGKSTLVNRLVGQREAIVEDTPGVTRDRLYLEANWSGRTFVAVDTGGLIPDESEDKLLQAVQAQAQLAIEEADVVIFLVDGREGLNAVDMEIANRLRRTSKPVILAVNKLDNRVMEAGSVEFYRLGMGDPFTISAMHGLGIGELLDAVSDRFPPVPAESERSAEAIRVALVGRPNVGKSSLINAMLGQQRLIVDDKAGTTRDAIDTAVHYDGAPYILIDTAGIRRKTKVDYGIEGFAVVRALKALSRADVVALVIDSLDGVTAQDQRIAGMIADAGKACLVVVNKWDLIVKDSATMKEHQVKLLKELFFLSFAPMLFTSATTRQRIGGILTAASAAAEEHQRRIPTGLLNEVVRESMALRPPPTDKGRALKLNYATQVAVGPPTFVLFVNNQNLLRDSYTRYLENKLRESFGFQGTPVRFIVREKKEGSKRGKS